MHRGGAWIQTIFAESSLGRERIFSREPKIKRVLFSSSGVRRKEKGEHLSAVSFTTVTTSKKSSRLNNAQPSPPRRHGLQGNRVGCESSLTVEFRAAAQIQKNICFRINCSFKMSCTQPNCTHPLSPVKVRAGVVQCHSCWNKAKTARCVARRVAAAQAVVAQPPPQSGVTAKSVAEAIFLAIKFKMTNK
jgi:hypothetical protein